MLDEAIADLEQSAIKYAVNNPPGTWMHGAKRVVERSLLLEAASQCCGEQLRMAELLGIDRNSLRDKLKRHEIFDTVREIAQTERAKLVQVGRLIDEGYAGQEIQQMTGLSVEELARLGASLTDGRLKKLRKNNKKV